MKSIFIYFGQLLIFKCLINFTVSLAKIPGTFFLEFLNLFFTNMMELVDMLGLGSSSFRVRVQIPFLVNI